MEYMRLRPAFRPYLKVYGVLLVLLVLLSLAAYLFAPDLQTPVLAVCALAVLAGLAWLGGLYYMHRANLYIILDSEIVEVTGIWIINEFHVPMEQIQDYNVGRTLFGEMLGVANVGIQTGRAERGFEVVMRSIHEKDRAALVHLLERFIRPKADEAGPDGLKPRAPNAGAPPKPPPGAPLFGTPRRTP